MMQPRIDPARRRLLLVEDDERWVEVLQSMLAPLAFDVVVARTLEEAQTALGSQPSFAVAVIDVWLRQSDPDDQSGLVLLERLRRTSPCPKLVVVTSLPNEADREYVEQIGAAYLAKTDLSRASLAAVLASADPTAAPPQGTRGDPGVTSCSHLGFDTLLGARLLYSR